MAVHHSRHPCNFLLPDRTERDRKEMDFPSAAPGLLDPSTFLFADGAEANPRKRGVESIGVSPAAPPQQSHAVNAFSLHPQPCSNQIPAPHPVSTGLRLSSDEQHQHQNQNQSNPLLFPSLSSSSSLLSSLLPGELAARLKEQKDEIDRFLRAQEGQLRRGLEERHRRHYRSLLFAAKESAVRRLREKEAELEQAARRSAELEDLLTRLRAESMSWQAKAMADQATASSLHAQLQQAAAARPPSQAPGGAESPEDAESVFEDSDRVESERACRACREWRATVVLLPCRHLCLCEACDGGRGAAESCPVCHCVKAGSVRVILA